MKHPAQAIQKEKRTLEAFNLNFGSVLKHPAQAIQTLGGQFSQ
jgi:hypothetical protein